MADTDTVTVKGYTLVNEAKVHRAINGAMNAQGNFIGGVKKADGTYDDDALLAEYDRIGGLIVRGEDKVATGSFYDFGARRPRAEAKVEFEFRISGEVVRVPAEKEMPNVVKAAKMVEEVVKKKVKKGKKE